MITPEHYPDDSTTPVYPPLSGDGSAEREFGSALLEMTASTSPLQVIFDVVTYLHEHDDDEVKMFDMIQRLKAACE